MFHSSTLHANEVNINTATEVGIMFTVNKTNQIHHYHIIIRL
jgi:phage anti-repressor protein